LEQYYPDGQIKVDLLGTGPQPISAIDALGQVIHAFNPEQTIPADQPEAEDLYQSCLHGKQVLLLLDNARDNDQVEPLLPREGCCLIVTSRLYLSLPGCEELALTPLTPEQAIKPLPKTDAEEEIDQDAGALAEPATVVPPESARGEAMEPAAFQRPGLIERMRKVDTKKIISPVGPLGMIGLFILIGVVFFIIYRLNQIVAPTPTPTIPVVTVEGTSTPTFTATSITLTDTPTITATPTPTYTDTPTPTHSSTPTHTHTPTPTYTSTIIPTPTSFPHLCFPIATWVFKSGWDETPPAPATSTPACYDAGLWGIDAVDGIWIEHYLSRSRDREVRYPLPDADDFNIHVDIILNKLSLLEGINPQVDLVIGLGDRPWVTDENTNSRDWFYVIRNSGESYLSQCLLYSTFNNCTSSSAIKLLDNLELEFPLNLQLDIQVVSRRVEAVVKFPQPDGTFVTSDPIFLSPLCISCQRWLSVGYRIQSGGSIQSHIKLYITMPTPTPSP